MAIQSTEIHLRLSGGASNTGGLTSLGGARSNTDIGTDLFDITTAPEGLAGDVEYRCIYVYNANATLPMVNAKLWIATNGPASDTLSIGLGTSAMNATEQTVADENTAPTGATFSAPTTEAAGLALGDIPALQSRAVWIKRTVAANTGLLNVSASLAISAETAA